MEMRQTTKKLSEKWVIIFLIIALLWHTIVYFTYQPQVEADYKATHNDRMFFISLYNIFYWMGIALNMLSNGKWWKVLTGVIIAIAGYLLYLEIVGNPRLWTLTDQISGIFAILQSVIVIKIIDKIKSRVKPQKQEP